MYRILIVEDDETIAGIMKEHLAKWDYEVKIVENFKNVMEDFAAFDPHIVLMDVGLPFYNGYHWCTQIRNVSKVPVIFISSMSDNMNIVMAMNMGGDDFITKPFDINVMTAKIQAMLRRTYSFSEKTNIIEHMGVVLNLNNQIVTYEEKNVELTKNEFRIKQTLMENVGKCISRDDIIEALWENETFIDDNTLTVNVTRLRKKLSEIGVEDFVKTRKGIGYIIE